MMKELSWSRSVEKSLLLVWTMGARSSGQNIMKSKLWISKQYLQILRYFWSDYKILNLQIFPPSPFRAGSQLQHLVVSHSGFQSSNSLIWESIKAVSVCAVVHIWYKCHFFVFLYWGSMVIDPESRWTFIGKFLRASQHVKLLHVAVVAPSYSLKRTDIFSGKWDCHIVNLQIVYGTVVLQKLSAYFSKELDIT